MTVLRNLDVVLLVIALGPALALGVPVLGYAIGGGGWVLQRVIAATDRRWTSKVANPVKQLGVNLFEAFGRIWFLAGMIVIAAVVGGHSDGLTAALVIFWAYSVTFVIRIISGLSRRATVR